ncbi:uncharacterized protein B0T15DRAFT_532296 [Chaetomium strumarium]|uniref:Uncharacterized protein n=1 Tax=Chaetomium strumarium TaxID=1170767 RepID=A0AAJ0GSQ2_9PEZI|nr:hypothetical protein B0T15DRAFT_532296 [Chaetomium strumarium]
MADPDVDRPGSRGYHTSPIPPSPRPSVASRASRSSLRREQERQEGPVHPRPASISYSRPHTPQAVAAPIDGNPRPPASHPPFQSTQSLSSPFFTLINSTSHSSNRQTVHYPTVQYVFADDDPEILTAALAAHHRGDYEGNGEEGERNGPIERAILLDLEPTADGSRFEVAWASSLSPDWAVTSARVSRMEGGGGPVAGIDDSLMLKIEGVGVEPASGPLGKTPTPEADLHASMASASRQQPPAAAEEYGDLLQDFEKRMATLRKVVETGAARQRALAEGSALENVAAPLPPGTRADDAQQR